MTVLVSEFSIVQLVILIKELHISFVRMQLIVQELLMEMKLVLQQMLFNQLQSVPKFGKIRT